MTHEGVRKEDKWKYDKANTTIKRLEVSFKKFNFKTRNSKK